MFAILQLLILIFTTILFHKGSTSPNLSSTGDYVAYEGISTTLAVSVGPIVGKVLIWMSTLYQGLYLYLQASSPSSIPTFFPQLLASTDVLPLTSISVVGYIFMIVGGLGRLWCYKTLGTLFTFELSIRSSHKLIKTGPYAYVRHPSYTFSCILTIGMLFIHQRLANFFPNTQWARSLFGPTGFLVCCIILVVFLRRRVIHEEEELRKTFGNEWTTYASKTKRFIPAVI